MGSVAWTKKLLKVSMDENELGRILSDNIKKYRKGIFTQESLAEKSELSVQLINGIEGGRKWVSKDSLSRIADALGVQVYQLFVPQSANPVVIDDTPENEKIRAQIQAQVLDGMRKSVNKFLDKMESDTSITV